MTISTKALPSPLAASSSARAARVSSKALVINAHAPDACKMLSREPSLDEPECAYCHDSEKTLIENRPCGHRWLCKGCTKLYRQKGKKCPAYKHDCWNWPTYKVMRDIILPATRDTRCRYADLPDLSDCFGPATVFMSHCWGAKFGDLIGA